MLSKGVGWAALDCLFLCSIGAGYLAANFALIFCAINWVFNTEEWSVFVRQLTSTIIG